MKKQISILFLICVFAFTAFTQTTPTLGFNGANWFDCVQDATTKQWTVDMVQPGGTFSLRYRADKFGVDAPNDLDSLIAFNDYLLKNNIQLKVVYCASMNATPQTNLNSIQYLIENDVNIICIENGNEFYSKEQANFNFTTYKNLFEPIDNLIESVYPGINFSVFFAPGLNGVKGTPGSHVKWNNEVTKYLKTRPLNYGASLHIYFNEKQCSIMDTLPVARVFNNQTFQSDLNYFYSRLISETNPSELWEPQLNFMRDSLPGRGTWVTEWGYSNSGEIKNTLGYAFMSWVVWNTYGGDKRISALMEHNGFGNTAPSCVFPASQYDLNPGGTRNIRRVNYWVFYMLNRIPVNTPEFTGQIITEPGTHFFWFINDTGASISTNVTVDDHLGITGFSVSQIAGKHVYSGSGSTAVMSRGSTPSMEVAGIDNRTDSIAGYSIGFMRVDVGACYDSLIAVTGTGTDCTQCKKFWFSLFHPRACKKCTPVVTYDTIEICPGLKETGMILFPRTGTDVFGDDAPFTRMNAIKPDDLISA